MPKRTPCPDCTNTCKSEKHANDLISAITLPSSLVLDKQVASFINSTCCCFDSVKDEFGRTVLHISASVGRKDLCQWLIRYSNVDIDAQDFESGYTPLHRSIFYGFVNVTVTLMQLGADSSIKDHEDYCPIDLCLRDINVELVPYLINSKFATKEVSCIASAGKVQKKFQDQVNIDVSYDALNKIADDKKDRLNAVSNAYFTEVYTWGTNHNYTNGFGAERSKKAPDFLEFFEKKNEAIIDVCMHKCHTLFVSLSGNVWSCGLGQGGRLGLSSEETVLIPQKIPFPSSPQNPSLFCIKAAAGQDHSIFVCNDNQILTCGSNQYHQLGLTPPPNYVNKPNLVSVEFWNEKALGAAASSYHSVIWTGSTLYTCGLHGGQLGHPNSPAKTFSSFKKVPCLQFQYTSITNVASSDGAIVVVTDADDIFLLNDYKCQKIDFRHIVKHVSTTETSLAGKITTGNHLTAKNLVCLQIVLKVSVMGGALDTKKVKSFNSTYRPEDLKIAVLLWNGSVYLWKKNKTDAETRFISCDFLVKHEIKVADLVLNSTNMMLVTRTGEAFVTQDETLKKTFNKNDNSGYTTVSYLRCETDGESYTISLCKIDNAHRAVCIFSDPKGDNFAILQERSADIMEYLPRTKSSFHSDFEKFYRESCDYETFPDITYQVDTKSFSAHKYIISFSSEELASLKPTNGVVHVKNVHPDIFKEALTFAYTGTCALFQIGACPFKVSKSNVAGSPGKTEDPIRLALKFARDYKMNKFASQLDKFKYENDRICLKNICELVRPVLLTFNRMKYRNLCDIKIKSQDGQVFHAHKCILVARMEYFKLMLSGFWMESSTNHEFQIPVAGAVLLEILDYLYSDNVAKSVVKKDLNFWCSLLVAADQFLLSTLKEICEYSLVQCLDVRNTVDILLFADTIDAKQLKKSCFEFISINLPSFLHSRNLKKLDDSLLNSLTVFHQNYLKDNLNNRYPRSVPVYSSACDPEKVISIGETFPIEWDVFLESDTSNDLKKKPVNSLQKKKIKRIRRFSTTETEKGKKSDEENKIPDIHENIIIDVKPQIITTPEGNWIEVEKQLKSVKSRLKINSAAKQCPEMIELKDNFTTLNVGKSETPPKQVPEPEKEVEESKNNKSSPITINIDFQNITPKLSQKQRKKLRTISESFQKIEELETTSPKNAWSMKCSSPPSDNSFDMNTTDCWGTSKSPEPVCFSAIVASEKKQKTVIKKETRKIESKTLQLAQIEDKAIQELITFYKANDIDEENITVQRVTYDFEAPQWVIK